MSPISIISVLHDEHFTGRRLVTEADSDNFASVDPAGLRSLSLPKLKERARVLSGLVRAVNFQSARRYHLVYSKPEEALPLAMRTGIVLAGFLIILLGFLISAISVYPIDLFVLIGIINIILGLATSKSPGLIFPSEPTSQVKMVVDPVGSRNTTYQVVFSDSKLIMKKLAGRTMVVVFAVIFLIIGGFISAVTGYSIGELVTQRRRDKIRRENTTMTVVQGDIEIPYQSMSQVGLTRNKLKFFSGSGPITMVMSKKYPPIIAAKLRELIPGPSWASPVTA